MGKSAGLHRVAVLTQFILIMDNQEWGLTPSTAAQPLGLAEHLGRVMRVPGNPEQGSLNPLSERPWRGFVVLNLLERWPWRRNRYSSSQRLLHHAPGTPGWISFKMQLLSPLRW